MSYYFSIPLLTALLNNVGPCSGCTSPIMVR